MEDRLLVILAFLLLGPFTGGSAIVDFTCITKPRIDIDSEDTYIAAYLHGGNAELAFHRTTFTHTGIESYASSDLRLPPNRSLERLQSSPGGDHISILGLPAAGGKTRIGAFACNAGIAGRDDVSIGTVIMSKAADFLPTRVSQTVNRGDAVNLTITATDPARTSSRWRKDGSEPFWDRHGRLYLDFINASVSDTGIYEAHFAGERSIGNQALMRLIVQGCEEHKWNAPQCDADCPVCLNGGVCDDLSGDCICPPGFTGDICETLELYQQKISATPSSELPTGACSVPPERSTPWACTIECPTTKATKTTKMAAIQADTNHYEKAIIL